jgi:hypothetical protein
MEKEIVSSKNTTIFNHESLAIEELKILSSIIGRIEGAIHQRQAWLVTILSGLTFALLKDSPYICKSQFVIFSLAIIIIFLVADAVQRVPVHRAIKRSEKVERILPMNKYISPEISEAIGKGTKCDFCVFWECFKKHRVFFPYLAMLAIMVLIFLVAP